MRKSYPQHTIITEESGEHEDRLGCSMGYRSTGWHHQLRQTPATLLGVDRSTH
ncbi:hypothetical protein ACNKHO_16020 [Shigella flexneri]